jgi:hypothetical protein
MATPFELAAVTASAAIDAVFGEVFEITAMKAVSDVNSPRIADETRSSFSVKAAFSAPSASTFPHGRGRVQDDDAQRVDITKPRISVDSRLLAWAARQGDRVTRLKTGDVFEISKVLPDSSSTRTVFSLTSRKRGEPQ